MKVAIRVDSSLKIGTGHVMRCLTLAKALSNKGAEIFFICRNHKGHVIGIIKNSGYDVIVLPFHKSVNTDSSLYGCSWLGDNIENDALYTLDILKKNPVDWLIVDHYSLDSRWESFLVGYYKYLMVIDDLANRKHICDLLLDQNLGRKHEEYQCIVPDYCHTLLGPTYALLRDEFILWRDYSLKRRQESKRIEQIFINMGGTDPDNITGNILNQLSSLKLGEFVKIIVVIGASFPWPDEVREIASKMKNDIDVRHNVANIAELMANSDLAIGAAGSTSWERCCLGLPSIVFAIAENQRNSASQLMKHDAAIAIESYLGLTSIIEDLLSGSDSSMKLINSITEKSSQLVDGTGAERVANYLLEIKS